MKHKVDLILNNWFGEPLEDSEDVAARLKYLYEPLRRLEEDLSRGRDFESTRSCETPCAKCSCQQLKV